jgi:hypothetical protein
MALPQLWGFGVFQEERVECRKKGEKENEQRINVENNIEIPIYSTSRGRGV